MIERFAFSDRPLPFFMRVAHLVSGTKAVKRETREAFWSSVAFYNFVQELAGTAARQRPTPAMWETGRPKLALVLEQLRPHCMLILGKQLAGNMQEAHHRFTIGAVAGEDVVARAHLLSDGSQVGALTISHPSSGRLKYEYWKPRVRLLLDHGRASAQSSGNER